MSIPFETVSFPSFRCDPYYVGDPILTPLPESPYIHYDPPIYTTTFKTDNETRMEKEIAELKEEIKRLLTIIESLTRK